MAEYKRGNKPRKKEFIQAVANAVYGGDLTKVRPHDIKHFARAWEEDLLRNLSTDDLRTILRNAKTYDDKNVAALLGLDDIEEAKQTLKQFAVEIELRKAQERGAASRKATKEKFSTTGREKELSKEADIARKERVRTEATARRLQADIDSGAAATPAARRAARDGITIANKRVKELGTKITQLMKKAKGKGGAGLLALLAFGSLGSKDEAEDISIQQAGVSLISLLSLQTNGLWDKWQQQVMDPTTSERTKIHAKGNMEKALIQVESSLAELAPEKTASNLWEGLIPEGGLQDSLQDIDILTQETLPPEQRDILRRGLHTKAAEKIGAIDPRNVFTGGNSFDRLTARLEEIGEAVVTDPPTPLERFGEGTGRYPGGYHGQPPYGHPWSMVPPKKDYTPPQATMTPAYDPETGRPLHTFYTPEQEAARDATMKSEAEALESIERRTKGRHLWDVEGKDPDEVDMLREDKRRFAGHGRQRRLLEPPGAQADEGYMTHPHADPAHPNYRPPAAGVAPPPGEGHADVFRRPAGMERPGPYLVPDLPDAELIDEYADIIDQLFPEHVAGTYEPDAELQGLIDQEAIDIGETDYAAEQLRRARARNILAVPDPVDAPSRAPLRRGSTETGAFVVEEPRGPRPPREPPPVGPWKKPLGAAGRAAGRAAVGAAIGLDVFDALNLLTDPSEARALEDVGAWAAGISPRSAQPLKPEEIEAIEAIYRKPRRHPRSILRHELPSAEDAERGASGYTENPWLRRGTREGHIVTKQDLGGLAKQTLASDRLHKYQDYMKGKYRWDPRVKDWVERTQTDPVEMEVWENIKSNMPTKEMGWGEERRELFGQQTLPKKPKK